MTINSDGFARNRFKVHLVVLFIFFVLNSSFQGQEFRSPLVKIALPFFPLVYVGNGINHMNINLVNLNDTGLKLGDEIGVFDSIYCVGSKVITERDIEENSLSIPASANNTMDATPNGFIENNTISLKVYRSETVYQLSFQLVNNSLNKFESGGSMFVLVDFFRSTNLNSDFLPEKIEAFPNPFSEILNIDITIQAFSFINCEILDLEGKLVKTLFQGRATSYFKCTWNGKDKNEQRVPSGIYICRINNASVKIIFK